MRRGNRELRISNRLGIDKELKGEQARFPQRHLDLVAHKYDEPEKIPFCNFYGEVRRTALQDALVDWFPNNLPVLIQELDAKNNWFGEKLSWKNKLGGKIGHIIEWQALRYDLIPAAANDVELPVFGTGKVT